jgi:hypothetical protein
VPAGHILLACHDSKSAGRPRVPRKPKAAYGRASRPATGRMFTSAAARQAGAAYGAAEPAGDEAAAAARLADALAAPGLPPAAAAAAHAELAEALLARGRAADAARCGRPAAGARVQPGGRGARACNGAVLLPCAGPARAGYGAHA